MNKKRNRLEIIKDILQAIKNKNNSAKPTHILYKSNLSHQMMKEYLEEMITGGMIEEKPSPKKSGGRVYSVKDKGEQYLSKYRMISEFTDSFGLNQ
ncbi:hypothetical protein COU61_02360 [Candidatus Pacearchaeota archaeon CG10_big_fil_rev_8_21_14_0_10_35_13]|nr:MAG: hypothetical protein COU61_02360 [Candidatus Pacearchaeota archaeon CG10_big_fil_rev_8_21_14_0_10_35_13]